MLKLRFNVVGSLTCGLGILLSFNTATIVRAEVRLPAIFSDHMVLQRDAAVPVWSWAEPGEAVTVSIAGQTKTATADAVGKWRVKLDKLSAGEALTLVVSGKNKITVNDVLVGEVWLGSGQSNMQMWMKSVRDLEQEKAAAKFPQLRMFTVARHEAVTPQTDCKGEWVMRLQSWRKTENLERVGVRADCFFIPALWQEFPSAPTHFFIPLWDGCGLI